MMRAFPPRLTRGPLPRSGARLWAVLLLLALVAGCRPSSPPVNASAPLPGEGVLTYVQIDVGQGDSQLILSPDGHAMLVDAGPPGAAEEILAVLKQYGVERLDYLVESHPHADHIGSMRQVIEEGPPVETFLASGYRHNSQVQARLLREIRDRKITGRLVRKGDTFQLGSYVTVKALQPEQPLIKGTESDPNNNSVVLQVAYGNTRILLTGDMEREERARLLTIKDDIQSDVLKVAHHGSHDGIDLGFIRRVRPKYAVISAERGNDYGHPHEETVKILKNAGTHILRTDLHGTLTLTSDGSSWNVMSEKNPPVSVNLTGREIEKRLGRARPATEESEPSSPPGSKEAKRDRQPDRRTGGVVETRSDPDSREEKEGSIIGNRNSKVYHVQGSGTTLPAPKNRVYFRSEEEASEAGFRPARR